MSNHASYAVRRKYRWQYDARGIEIEGIIARQQQQERAAK